MDLAEILTKREKRIRRGWLVFLFCGCVMSAVVWFIMPVVNRFFLGAVNIAITLLFSYLYYVLCYKRQTTFLLTVSLVSFWISLLWNGVCFAKGMIELDLLFGCSLTLGVVNYLFTRKLRCLNKALRGYAKFPEESKEATAFMRSATSFDEQAHFFSEAVKKWPHLKWVLQREWNMKP